MKASRQSYIDQYAEYAMEQMRRYGIPASITLAQGIIESADGQSTLAKTANNHFGVKGAYNGNYVLANDDKPNEHFKKYDNVGQSYEDHSKVLMASRYQRHVGKLSPDDYRGWAAGIQRGGYATAKNYSSTLVSVIEGANLQRFDQMVMQQMRAEGRQFGVQANPLSAEQHTSTPAVSQNAGYSMPVKRDEFMLITSPYGSREDPINKGKTQIHHGIDIKTNKDNVLATENNGTVIGVDHRTTTGGGKTVTVEYSREDGSKTRVQYMHLSEISVKKGDVVNAGHKLGVTGNTGTRTTGEHLHLGVINVSADNKLQWVNPAAYLAEIAQKGNLTIEAQHNGKDLLADYKTAGAKATNTEEQTPEGWMNRLLGSDDAALGINSGEDKGILGNLMEMFMTLLMLAMQQEGCDSARAERNSFQLSRAKAGSTEGQSKSKEQQMQTISDALVNRRIDISSLVPNMRSAAISLTDNGKAILSIHDGKQEFSHELTEAERNNISQVLHSDSDDQAKQQRLGGIVSAITYSHQAANIFKHIDAERQSQEQTLQRK